MLLQPRAHKCASCLRRGDEFVVKESDHVPAKVEKPCDGGWRVGIGHLDGSIVDGHT